MVNNDLIQTLNNRLQIALPQHISQEELMKKLSAFIDHLIINDFNKLVSILYKTDVNENQLKQILKQDPQQDAALIIAELILQREQQKFYSRKHFSDQKYNFNEDKW
jgi:hypothetical protein